LRTQPPTADPGRPFIARAAIRLAPVVAGLACLAAAALPAQAAEPWGFEQVTPVDKRGGAVSVVDTFQAHPDGDSFLHTATSPYAGVPTEGAPQYTRYLGIRGPDSWINRPLDPPLEPGIQSIMGVVGTSSDLAHAVVASGRALAPGATEGGGNLYMVDTHTGVRTLIATHENIKFAHAFSVPMGGLATKYVASDGRSALFLSEWSLTDGAPELGGASNLYAWRAGSGLELLSVLPESEGGGPARAWSSSNNGEQLSTRNSMPEGDGLAHVYFGSGTEFGFGPAYVRSGGETRAISVSQISGADPTPVPANVIAVARDGKYALISTAGYDLPLTEDTPAIAGGYAHLYRYGIEDDSLVYVGTLGASGYVIQMTQDGQTVAFRSPHALTGDAVEWGDNVYVWRDGALQLVAVGQAGGAPLNVLSSNGRYLGFTDVSTPLAAEFGQDNVSAACPAPWTTSPGPCAVAYVYDVDSEQLACASCRPDGAPVTGSAGDPPAGVGWITSMNAHQMRTVADDGTAFFTSSDDLLPSDSNGTPDVYAYKGGELRLVSRAAQGTSARFLDATPDGKSVFFSTDDAIVPTDTDRSVDVYMTREGAGYPYTAPPVDPPCTGGDCRDPFAGGGGLAPIGSLTFVAPERSGPVGGAAVRVSALKAVTGARATLRVRVPAAGSIRVSGASVRGSSRRATRAATYRVGVRLSAKARKSLGKRGQLKVRVRVAFRASGGSASSRTVTVTFKRPKSGSRSTAGGR
jgi:hypothetical protein